MNPLKFKIILPTLVFIISFGVYIFTLNPSLSAADSSEIVNASIVLGIPHQPSYPVNTIIGHLFSKIPFGPLPWRVNLMSAMFQSLTVLILYFVILKLYRLAKEGESGSGDQSILPQNSAFKILNSQVSDHFIAAASALFLAFSLVYWQYGTRAEVFPLNNFFAAALILIILAWWEKVRKFNHQKEVDEQIVLGINPRVADFPSVDRKPQVANYSPQFSLSKTRKKYPLLANHLPDEALGRLSAYRPPPIKQSPARGLSLSLFYLFAFVSGLALTHHQTIVFLIPCFLFVLFKSGLKFWFTKKAVTRSIIYFLLGTLPYLSLIPMAQANPSVKWGTPENLKGVFRAITRSDYGTFSPYAQNPATMEGQTQKETPITQQTYYLTSLNRDFTLLGIILALLGAFFLWRKHKNIFITLFLGFFLAGPFFLGFANYTLDSGFHQAVAKRFQMLPDIFFTLFLAFGLFYLWEKFRNLDLDLQDMKNALVAVLLMVILSSVFLYPLVHNFKDADDRDNFLTFNYAHDSLAPTPKNALVLISGDITTFAFQYWQTMVEKDTDRIIFSPGLLYLDWYVERIKKEHPEIVIPAAKAGHIQASTTEVVDANWGKRPIYISPELARYDPEVEKKYVLWPKHLLFLVKQKGDDLKLESYRAENEAFWQSHNLKLMDKIRKNNPLLEYAMVPEYARHHANLGGVFESVHLYDDAIREYERALKIHPAFPDPYKNLGRIYGFKLKEKDYQKAFAYFNMFLTTALPSQKDDVTAVQEAIGELQQNAMREATDSASLTATPSASLSASQSGQLRETTESGKAASASSQSASPALKLLH